MATAIIHGDPGSYKTSTLISDYLVPAIKQGRVVVTNIRGVKPIEDIADLYGFDLPDTSDLILVPFDQAGFVRMATFFHWVPQGALILMDEGQRVYPTRLRDFQVFDLRGDNPDGRPITVEDAFDSHRHMNWDIYISTPNIGKIHKEIRAVAEFGYRHKNMATVFAFMKGRYKRVTHNAENSGSAMGHAISSTIRKIDARCFNVYESTATGQAKDSQAGFNFFKQPKVLLLLLVIGYSIWNMGFNIYSHGGLPSLLGGSAKPSPGSSSTNTAVATVQASTGFSSDSVHLGQLAKNPFSGLTIHLVGQVNARYLFEIVYQDRTFITLDQYALEQLGFSLLPISQDIVRLVFESESILVLSKPISDLVQVVPPQSVSIL